MKNKFLIVNPCDVFKDSDIIVNYIKNLGELIKTNLNYVIKLESLSCEALDMLSKAYMNITEMIVCLVSYFNKTYGSTGEVDLGEYISEFYKLICCTIPVEVCCNIDFINRIPEGVTIMQNRNILTQILVNIIILIYLSSDKCNPRITISANYIKKNDIKTVAITIIDQQDDENLNFKKAGKYIGFNKSERLTICANFAKSIGGKFMTSKIAETGRAYILLLDV